MTALPPSRSRPSPVAAFLLALSLLLLPGCLTLPPSHTPADASKLAAALGNLGPRVDASEARILADTALSQARILAERYRSGSSPRLHNLLVNTGLRDRGLCWHYADDLLAALRSLQPASLSLHEVVSREGSALHEHHAVVVSARGRPFSEGIVLDPWRRPGSLFWMPVGQDPAFRWAPPTPGS